MQLYCPNCRKARPLGLRCPECDVRLVSAGEAHEAVLTGRPLTPPPPPQATLAARVVVGVVVGLGTVIALRDMVLGGLGFMLGSEANLSEVPVLGVAFAGVGAAVGGLLAGAGLGRGEVAGGLAGGAVGLLATTVDALLGDRPPLAWADLALAAGLAIVAVATGRVGSRFWPPAMPLPKVGVRHRSSSVARLVESAAQDVVAESLIRWERVGLAAVLIVFAVWNAEGFRIAASQTLIPQLRLSKMANHPAAGGALAVTAAVLGGALAGASTRAGWRQGLYTGLASAAVMAALVATGDKAMLAPFESLAKALPKPFPDEPLALIVGSVGLITAGGAFGAALLPVLAAPKRRTPFS